MTADDIDKEAGRTRREWRQAEAELGALQSKARRLGEFLGKLGHVLVSEPESMIFNNQSYDPRFITKITVNDTDFSELTAESIRNMTSEIRDAIVKGDNLRAEVAKHEGREPEGKPYRAPSGR